MSLLFALFVITILFEAKKIRPDNVNPQSEIFHEEEIDTYMDDEVQPRYIHVPFGHIFKSGINPKDPVDLLELENLYPKMSRNRDLKKKNERTRVYASPKDALLNGEKLTKEKKGSKEVDMPDFADLFKRSITSKRRRVQDKRDRPIIQRNDSNLQLHMQRTADYIPKEQFFSASTFKLKRKDFYFNWTTCDEFGHNADFHPKDVVTMDWVPFYVWTPPDEPSVSVAYVHRFSYPTVKLVKKYHEEFGIHMNATTDWMQPKLLLMANFEMLLIAADRRGEFIGIPHNEIPSTMKRKQFAVPTVNLRLKIVDPYLAMMFCDYRYATIMAISGNEPDSLIELRAAAATLKFHGRGYPVARNIELERMVARREKEQRIEYEREKEDFTI